MLSDRCLFCLSSVTLVYCGHTVRWIKTKLGVRVGLGVGHMVLDGDPAPPRPKGHSPPIFGQYFCGQMAELISMPLGRKVGLYPCDIVLNGDPAPPPQKGAQPIPQF